MKTLYSLLFAALLVLPATAFAQVEGACEAGYPGKLVVFNPPAVAGLYNAGVPAGDVSWPDTTGLLPPGTSGDLVIVQDPGEGDIAPNLGCTEFSNAEEIAGNIAFVQRGACNFSLKALNAQNAGAIGALLWNNDAANPDAVINMAGGDFGPEVQIATLFVSLNTGEAIREQLEDFEETVSVNLTYDDCYLTVAAEENVIPGTRELSAAHPNPFADRTQFELSLDQAQRVSVSVYNVLGQKVATLHEGALSADTHRFAFEATALPAGVYLIRAEGENFAQTRQVTLVR
jgi:hypothetical protein